MASSYTDIGTELMTTGENAGTWGSKTNTNIQILEEKIAGYVAVSANSDQTLSLTDGSTGDSIRNAIIAFTGTLSANRTITVPAIEQVWIMDNQTAGAYTLTVKASGQTGVTWAATDKGTKILYANGTDVTDTGIASNKFAPDSADGEALGSSSKEFSDLYLADSGVIYFGNDQDTTLTHTDGTGLTLNSSNKLLFRDTGLTIGSNADGDLDIVSDGTAIDSINIESAGGITLDAGTASSGVAYEDDGTEMLRIYNSSSDVIIQNKVDAKDIVFQQYDGNEVARFADNRKMYFYDEGGEIISSDGTDFTFNSGNDINLTATTDINIPANVGLTFGDDAEKIEGDGTDLTITGNTINLTATTDVALAVNTGLLLAGTEKIESDGTDLSITVGAGGDINIGTDIGLTFGNDGEKIEGDGTDLTISGNNINLTATADVVIPADVGITFGTGEKIEGDSTDLTVTSGGAINLTATTDVVIPNSVGIQFGGASEKIEGDGTDLTISANNLTVDAAADIILDAAGNNITFKSGGTAILDISNSSSDAVIQPKVNAKDIIFKQYDGNILLTIDDAGFVGVHNSAAGPGELRIYEDTDNGSHYTGFKAGNATASVSYVLPVADGSDGQQLTTDGSGTLTWSAATVSSIAADDIGAGDAAVTIGNGSTSADVTLDSGDDVVIDAAGGNVEFKDAGTLQLTLDMDGTAGEQIIQLGVNSDDLVFKQYDGTEVFRMEDGGYLNVSNSTASSSATTGSAIFGGGIGVAADAFIGDDLTLISDSAVLGFGADTDTTLTHTDGTGLTLNGTNKLCFYDTALSISSSTDGQLDIDADTEVEITATTVDLNGILDVSGVLVAGGQISASDGTAGAPSISNTGDLNTGLLFSAADTMQFSSGGTAQFTMADGAITPVTDNDVDLGSNSLQFKNLYVNGTTFTDAIGFGTTVMTLPTADGDADQVLKTDGSGTIGFATSSGIGMGKAIAAALVFG